MLPSPSLIGIYGVVRWCLSHRATRGGGGDGGGTGQVGGTGQGGPSAVGGGDKAGTGAGAGRGGGRGQGTGDGEGSGGDGEMGGGGEGGRGRGERRWGEGREMGLACPTFSRSDSRRLVGKLQVHPGVQSLVDPAGLGDLQLEAARAATVVQESGLSFV